MKHLQVTPFVACLMLMTGSLPAALVAHYKLDETSGTTLADSSGSGYDGAVVGTGGDLNVSGTIGSAYEPGGAGSYGRVTNGVSSFGIGGNNARTVSFWFNTPNFGGSSDQYRVLGMGSGAGSTFNIVAESGTNAGGSNRIGLRYGNGNVYFDADNSGTAFSTNTWYHVAAVYDGTNMDLESIGTASDGTGLIFYVNGIEMDTAGGNLNNGTQTLNTALTDFALGAHSDGVDPSGSYPGLLDDVQVYDRALSAAEVLSLYQNPGSTITDEQPEIVSAEFNGASFEVVVTNLDGSTSYVLKRSATLDDGFPTVVDGPRLPTADGSPETDTFNDPSPPSSRGFYRLEEAP